ncbi:hypothetical protein RvY_15173 [Ramazzottius varieornatus]|uniref:Uncharacterized protein n=1 Tax=Ramazzottius varieornatus TaxID=947166 RepID=A0A1D1VYS2_RAMVA|nr:hypothetical protein RvY_15173 [Ramazzottius varieornatus]
MQYYSCARKEDHVSFPPREGVPFGTDIQKARAVPQLRETPFHVVERSVHSLHIPNFASLKRVLVRLIANISTYFVTFQPIRARKKTVACRFPCLPDRIPSRTASRNTAPKGAN